MIKKATEQEMAQWQRNVQHDQASREPVAMNVGTATTTHDVGYIELSLKYRKRQFKVPPVSYREGVRLMVLERHVARLQVKLQEDERRGVNDAGTIRALTEMAETFEEMVGIFWRLVRPVGWWDRLTWRWRQNPFLNAEPQEIGVLRDFFCVARTRCRVRWTASIRAPRFLRLTYPMSLRPLSLGSAGGWMRTESPAAGGIIESVLLR